MSFRRVAGNVRVGIDLAHHAHLAHKIAAHLADVRELQLHIAAAAQASHARGGGASPHQADYSRGSHPGGEGMLTIYILALVIVYLYVP